MLRTLLIAAGAGLIALAGASAWPVLTSATGPIAGDAADDAQGSDAHATRLETDVDPRPGDSLERDDD